MAMGHGSAASLAPGRTTVKARHLGVRGGLVDEDNPRRIEIELSFKPSLTLRVHRAATLFGGMRRPFFARDLAALEEPPECANADDDAALPQMLAQLRQGHVALGRHRGKDQLGMRLDPLRMAVTALAPGPDVALASLLSPPPDRARRANAKPLRRRSAGQSAPNRVNDTPAKVNRQGSRHASPASFAGQKHESEPSRFGNPSPIQSERKTL
jgi:hypothetical protein